MKKTLLLLSCVGSLLYADESVGDKIVLADHMHSQQSKDAVTQNPQPTTPTGESLLTKLAQACGKEGSSLDVYALTSEATIKVIAALEAVGVRHAYRVQHDPFFPVDSWS